MVKWWRTQRLGVFQPFSPTKSGMVSLDFTQLRELDFLLWRKLENPGGFVTVPEDARMDMR
jgi:hypothetical protein